jgi:hypothetical protein
MIRFRCPHCQSHMEVDESFGGRAARCPTCGTELRIPKAEETRVAKALEESSKSGATVVRVGGKVIEIVPPLDLMAVVGVVLLGVSVAVALAVGLTRVAQFPWTIGLTLGAGVALVAAMTGLPAYYNVRRSRGRKRGKVPALVAAIGGAALAVLFGAGAVAGWVNNCLLRPSCEDNLHRIHAALLKHAAAHDGEVLPRQLELLVRDGYLESKYALTCPAYAVPPGIPTYIMHVGRPPVNLNDLIFPANLALVSDGPPYDAHPDGGVRVLLLSGEVKVVPHRQWQAFLDDQRQLWNDIQRKAEKRRPTDPTPEPDPTPEEDAVP